MIHKSASEKWHFYVSLFGVIVLLGVLIATAYLFCKQEGMLP